MRNDEVYKQLQEWKYQHLKAIDALIDMAANIGVDIIQANALAILAREFGTVIPITPETMEAFKEEGKRQIPFNIKTDVDFERSEIRLLVTKVSNENSSNGQ